MALEQGRQDREGTSGAQYTHRTQVVELRHVSHFAPTLNSGAGTVLLWEEDRPEKWVKKRGPAEKYKKYRKLNKWSRSRVNGSLILGRIVIRGNLLQEYSPKSGRQILRHT